MQAQAEKTARERLAAQANLEALKAPLIRLVREQPDYERLARQQLIPAKKLPQNYTHVAAPVVFGPDVERLIALVGPYDYDWKWELAEPGSHGVSQADKKTGTFGGHTDNDASCGSAVGTYFRPSAAEAWVRSVSVIKYGIYWVANSHFMTAHTDASIGVQVLSSNLAGGDVQVDVDSWTSIYDITSYDLSQQQNELDGLEIRPSVEFRALNQRHYFLWTLCSMNTWGNDGNNPTWSQAYGNLWATTVNIVIWQ